MMNKAIKIEKDDNLTAQEVVDLRLSCNWDGDIKEWEESLKQNLINVSARSDNRLVGVGFICGNARHAEIIDLVVATDFRNQGIAESILNCLMDYAQTNSIKYLSINYDNNHPWLKDFYAKHGFRSIDFAMWHESSIKIKNRS